MRKIFFSVLTLIFLFGITLDAQKYGHLNSGNLLQSLSEVKSADEQLKAFQAELLKKGEGMAKSFETKFKAYYAKAEAGELSQVQMQQEEQKLQAERESIMAYEQEIMQKVAEKREELLKPILEKVDQAIQAVGKENSYMMIFDTSLPNAILFVEEADDVTALVKQKLGV